MATFPIVPIDRLPAPFSTHPLLLVVTPITFTVLCFLTRLITTLQFYFHPSASSNAPIVPYSIPVVGHVVTFARHGLRFLAPAVRKYPHHAAFTIKLGRVKVIVLLAPSFVDQVMIKKDNFNKLSTRNLGRRLLETFGGDRRKEFRNVSDAGLHGPANDTISGPVKNGNLNSILSATTKAVERGVPNIVSGLSTVVDMEPWERAAGVEIISSSDETWFAQANLFELLRSFVGTISIDILLGREFLANNPDFNTDIYAATSQLNHFMLGVPEWLPHMQTPVRARNRVVEAVREHRLAHLQFLRGEDPGSKWGDMDDLSSVIRDRALAWDKAGVSIDVAARVDAIFIIGLMTSTPKIIFWMLWHVFSNPVLLDEIRKEISPYVKSLDQQQVGTIKEAGSAQIDLEALQTKCPLFVGAYLETLRLESVSTPYKEVMEDFVIQESKDYAATFSRSIYNTRKYLLKKGEYVCIPSDLHSHDARYFPNPETFNARRFGVVDQEEDAKDDKPKTDTDGEAEAKAKAEIKTSSTRVDTKTLHPWFGGGNHSTDDDENQSPTRNTFSPSPAPSSPSSSSSTSTALLFTASLLTFWDITPAPEEPWYAGLGEDLGGVIKMGGPQKEGEGEWRYPGRKERGGDLGALGLGFGGVGLGGVGIGVGVVEPVDPRRCVVRMRRRDVAVGG